MPWAKCSHGPIADIAHAVASPTVLPAADFGETECPNKGSFVTTSPFGCRDYKTVVDGGPKLPSQNQSPENS